MCFTFRELGVSHEFGTFVVPRPGSLLRTSTGYHTTSEGIWNKENMSDGEENEAHNCEDEQFLDKAIDKETHKLEYFSDKTDELIQLKDYTEMEIANRRAEKIVSKLSDRMLHVQVEELKIDHVFLLDR